MITKMKLANAAIKAAANVNAVKATKFWWNECIFWLRECILCTPHLKEIHEMCCGCTKTRFISNTLPPESFFPSIDVEGAQKQKNTPKKTPEDIVKNADH